MLTFITNNDIIANTCWLRLGGYQSLPQFPKVQSKLEELEQMCGSQCRLWHLLHHALLR